MHQKRFLALFRRQGKGRRPVFVRTRTASGFRRGTGTVGISFDRNPQGTQEIHILRGEGFFAGLGVICTGFQRAGLLFHFVEANRGFQHEQHFETLFADILYHACDVLRLGDRFVNRLSKLLNEISQS
jgi:hypothetical protein